MEPIENQESVSYIAAHPWSESKLGLERTEELLCKLGNPEKSLKFVHVAGTNGKGSTSSMLSSVLREAGYRTGLFTSPFIIHFNERIQIDGVPVADKDLNQITKFVREIADNMTDHPTEFELITAIALVYFYEKKADIVVLEVGLGGRLDSTNVIETPEVAVITNIGLDHIAELGDTVEKIAAEKAGIIKRNGDVVCYPQKSSVEKVIREKCSEMNAQFHAVDTGTLLPIEQHLDGQKFDFDNWKNLNIPLLGKHQLMNASVVLSTLAVLKNKGWHITDNAIHSGLKKTSWPGRFEVIQKKPIFIVDGAHNPQGARTTAKNIETLFPNEKVTFIIGVLKDKDYKEVIESLIPFAKRFITVTPDSPRALNAIELAEFIQNYHVDSVASETIEAGVDLALESCGESEIICALGSLYMIGTVLKYVKEGGNQ